MKIQWTGRVLGTPSGKWQPPRKTETYNTPDQPGTDDPGVRQPRKVRVGANETLAYSGNQVENETIYEHELLERNAERNAGRGWLLR